jgi:signal transduction histidine kinase
VRISVYLRGKANRVRQAYALFAVSLAVIVPAFAIILWFQHTAFGRIDRDFCIVVLSMLIAVGLFFPLLRLWAESRITQSLFAEKQASRIALRTFTHSIVRILDREKLLRELAGTLTATLRLNQLAVFILEDNGQVYVSHYATGRPVVTREFTKNDPLIATLRTRDRVVLRDEFAANGAEGGEAVEVCRRNGWEACMPLVASSQLIGFIGLGHKQDFDAFCAEEIDLLDTLAAEASVALENVRLYEELNKAQEIIHRADRLSALGTLAAGIAHEVRNPLVSIQTFFQLAPDRLHDEEFLTTFLGMAAGEVKRISDLITELLSFARSPAKTLGPANLNEVAERVARLLDPEARKHKLRFTRMLSSDLPAVYADADQIKQVLINLVLNAIEATAPGGEVSLFSRVGEHQNGSFVQLEIHDSGVGIPEAHIDDVFNPFFTTKEKGTGLGLAIVHQIIAEHGGSIVIESGHGRGTSFFVNLPAITQHPAVSQSEEIVGNREAALADRVPARKLAS